MRVCRQHWKSTTAEQPMSRNGRTQAYNSRPKTHHSCDCIPEAGSSQSSCQKGRERRERERKRKRT